MWACPLWRKTLEKRSSHSKSIKDTLKINIYNQRTGLRSWRTTFGIVQLFLLLSSHREHILRNLFFKKLTEDLILCYHSYIKKNYFIIESFILKKFYKFAFNTDFKLDWRKRLHIYLYYVSGLIHTTRC